MMKKKNSELMANSNGGSVDKKRETSKPKDFLTKDVTNALIGNYKVIKVLGRGGFGTVYECFDQERGRTVAIKQVDLTGTTADEQESILMEIQLLQELQHPNIVKYIDTVTEDSKLNIVLEYIESGQLSSLFTKSGGQPSEVLMTNYVSQILTGLQYLHSQGVVHRDVKGANILTTKEGILKLADFGVATKLTEHSEQPDVVGSPYWMAPEIIEMKGSNDSSACDIWSLGCTIIELLTGKPPYLELNAMAAMYRIVQDDFPPYPTTISADMDSFLKKCFCKDPELRASAEELLRHPWITKNVAVAAGREPASPGSVSTDKLMAVPTPRAAAPAAVDRNQAGLDMNKYIGSLADLPESAFLDNCKDLEKLLTGQAAHSLRIRLLHSGIMPFLDHFKTAKTPGRVIGLMSVLFETLQPVPDKGVTRDLTNDIAAVCMTAGLISQLVKHCTYSEHPFVRANTCALLRYLCFANGPLFVCAGGLSGLVSLLDVEYASNAVRLPFTALDCIDRLNDCPPLCSDDVARILAGRHDMVKVITSCLAHAHDLHPNKIKDTLPKRLKEDKKKKLMKHKTLSQRLPPLPPQARGSFVEGEPPLSPRPKDKNKGSLRAPLETPTKLGDDLLGKAVALCVCTPKNGQKVGHVDDSASPINGSWGIIEKLAKHVQLLAKAPEEVQLMFATRQEIETLMDVCVSCPQGQIVSCLLSTFSTLVSSNTVLKAILKDSVNSDSIVLVHLISLLDRFVTTDLSGTQGNAAGWAIADIVFVLYKLVTDPKALGVAETKQDKNEMSLLASLVDLGLVPLLQDVMSAVAENAAKKEEGKSRVGGNMRTIRLTVSVNAANIQGKRDTPCALHDFIFPLLSRIAREEDPAIRATLHAWSPKLFLPLLAHPVFRGETLDILIIWLLDDPKTVEEFMALPSTIACIVVALFEGSAQETHSFLLALYRMFSHSARINRCYSGSPEFILEIRKCVTQKHEKHNLHTNIKISALKLIHQMLSNSEALDKLIQALDLKNLLVPLCADDKNKIVHKLSTELRHQFLERDDLDGQAGKGEKYRRRDIKKCMNCKKSFGIMHRKHMCKQCQHIVCNQCSKQKLIVPQLDKVKPRRVCNNCASFLGN